MTRTPARLMRLLPVLPRRMLAVNADGAASTRVPVPRAALRGALAGAAGVAVMTAVEKIEQAFTARPNSYVPAHTLERLLRLPRKPDHERWALNHAMHWGTGIAVGTLRGIMASGGLRGPWASFMHSAVRLTTDQTVENVTGVGSPPWTWPRSELVIDLSHKLVYALATGAVADRLVAAPDRASAG